MSQEELRNLVRINQLKVEPASRSEFAGMVKSARTRLADAQNKSLDPDSQFDLAYSAAHRLALAALRRQGYRSENRITVFQTIVHTGRFGSCRRADLSQGPQRAKPGGIRGPHGN